VLPFDAPQRTQRPDPMSASARSLLPELGSDPVAAVRAGVPTAALDRLQSHLQVSDARLAPLLGVSSRALLGGETPLDRMDTGAGMAEVTAMLYHIEYGMPV
jgi:hypothetical protein